MLLPLLLFRPRHLCLHGLGQTEIKVGVIFAITGREAKPGQYQKEGVELAIKQINEQGGVIREEPKKKLPIKEIFYDDGSDQASRPRSPSAP